MVLYVKPLLGDRTQKFGYGINAIFPIVAVLWGKNSEKQRRNSGCFRCFLLAGSRGIEDFCRTRRPRSLIIPGKNSVNSETVASNLHEAHPRRHSGAPSPGPAKPPPKAELRRDFGRPFQGRCARGGGRLCGSAETGERWRRYSRTYATRY